MKTSKIVSGLAGLCLLAVALLCGAGCESFNGAPPGNLAAVTITNQPMANVQSAVASVFEVHGFTGGQTGPNEFTFSRLGSRADDIAYGSYIFQEPVTVKVVVKTREISTGHIEVGCNAWLIEAENDPLFQDSHRVRLLRKWPYEQLLQEVKTQSGE